MLSMLDLVYRDIHRYGTRTTLSPMMAVFSLSRMMIWRRRRDVLDNQMRQPTARTLNTAHRLSASLAALLHPRLSNQLFPVALPPCSAPSACTVC